MAEKDQLPIPGPALRDRKSLEVLRVWVAEQGQHVSLRTGIWDDPAAWGIVLADLAGHVANAYEEEKGIDRDEALQRITAALLAELSSPTDTPAGQIQH